MASTGNVFNFQGLNQDYKCADFNQILESNNSWDVPITSPLSVQNTNQNKSSKATINTQPQFFYPSSKKQQQTVSSNNDFSEVAADTMQEAVPSDQSTLSRISVFKKHDEGLSATGKTEALIRVIDGKVQQSDTKLLTEASLSSQKSFSVYEEEEK